MDNFYDYSLVPEWEVKDILLYAMYNEDSEPQFVR